MRISELCDLFDTPSRHKAIDGIVGNKKIKRAAIDGLAGSSPAMLFSRLPERHAPYLIVANDLDEAGYMYNDLCRINGDKDVLLFPSGYKRDIKYGQEDPPSQILRAEVLNRWDDKQLRWVVTYPEALAEKVA